MSPKGAHIALLFCYLFTAALLLLTIAGVPAIKKEGFCVEDAVVKGYVALLNESMSLFNAEIQRERKKRSRQTSVIGMDARRVIESLVATKKEPEVR